MVAHIVEGGTHLRYSSRRRGTQCWVVLDSWVRDYLIRMARVRLVAVVGVGVRAGHYYSPVVRGCSCGECRGEGE